MAVICISGMEEDLMRRDWQSRSLAELMQAPWFQEETALGDLARWFTKAVEANLSSPLWTERYGPLVEAQAAAEEPRPFLTVVMRTQFSRRDALTEALLSLMAQSDPDFEVVLIPHKIPERLAEVRETVDSFPESFRRRVRLLPLEGGNRTTPLNYGFAQSRGEYVAVLDDDDVVLERWVEGFHQAAKAHPGTVAHCWAVNQDWRGGENDRPVYAVGAPQAAYCQPFSALVELRINRCPVFSLAFPGWVFRELGFLFDEELTTLEDWDFLRRVTAVCGVTDVPRVGGIYRLWQSGTSSHAQHRETEWKRNFQRITDPERAYPVVVRRDQAEEREHLSWMAEMERKDAEETARVARDAVKVEDLQSIIAAQRETIEALEGPGLGGRFIRLMRLAFHRLKG
jgi:glycosyltransferase involved in cell wall biosynthesis